MLVVCRTYQRPDARKAGGDHDDSTLKANSTSKERQRPPSPVAGTYIMGDEEE